jgi:hypothetical protein
MADLTENWMVGNWVGKWVEHLVVWSVVPWVVDLAALWVEGKVVSRGDCSVALRAVWWVVHSDAPWVDAKAVRRAVPRVWKRADNWDVHLVVLKVCRSVGCWADKMDDLRVA